MGISINVILLGIVSLLTDISSEMIHPLLPMFIIALGGGGLAIGLVGGLGDSLASILKVFAGWLWQYFSPEASFLYGAGLGFLAALLFILIGRKLIRT